MELVWDEVGKRLYETGVDKGVLYPLQEGGKYDNGVVWNGLSAVTQNPSGAEPTPIYADNMKYLNLMSAEEFSATLEAYMYPDEFAECDGSRTLTKGVTIGQQKRKTFGLCYRTKIGNDVDGDEHGYKLHLVYGALAKPSSKAYKTASDNPEAITMSWELSTTPVAVTDMKPTAHLEIDSTKCDAAKLKEFEKILYGSSDAQPRLPLPDEVKTLMTAAALSVG